MTAALLLTASGAIAHDVPNDVVVQAFVKPEPNRVRLLVRVPLAALRDVDVPTRGAGYLDLARAEEVLRGAAAVWITQELELYEEDERLYPSQIVAVLLAPVGYIVPDVRTRVGARNGSSARSLDRDLLEPRDPRRARRISRPVRNVAFCDSPRLGAARAAYRRPPCASSGPTASFGPSRCTAIPASSVLIPQAFRLRRDSSSLGFEHILSGADHLLFLLCLVIPLRRVRTLVAVVTAFTVAHSVTLVASAYDLAPSALWFPPLVETLIAASIVYMALENILGARAETTLAVSRSDSASCTVSGSRSRCGRLSSSPGRILLTSLLAFNVGVELGQLLVLAIAVPALALLFRRVDERLGTIILSAFVAHTAWHWLTARGEQLMQFSWPTVDAATLAGVVRWVMVLVAMAAVWWLSRVLMRLRPNTAYEKEVEGGV